ncbi:serine hydrolase [Mycetocola spongiae]|uniref:serine hydrolase n=1 Tax=Mycetocola spongiae TaxID=2859226 RepID=UPI001CF16DAE|nr:serine hydrolase [Mycetocola spongiae]UCR88725.1 serine hydrolase [Mycetocola spongiae]
MVFLDRPSPHAPGPRPRGRASRRVVALLAGSALLLGLGACAATPTEGSPASASAESLPPVLPDTVVGQRAGAVLQLLNAASPPTEAELTALLAPGSLAQVTPAGFIEVFKNLQEARPWTLTSFDSLDVAAEGVISGSKGAGELSMRLILDESDLIETLWFGAVAPPRTPATSWEEVGKEVVGLPSNTSLRVARVDGDIPEVIVESGESAPRPLGSIFKLYVLGALVDAIEAGTIGWDDELTVTEGTRSLPSGQLQNLPDGATVTVREAAQKAIEISDNTGTDLLIAALGREAVEAVLPRMGQREEPGQPARNVPFLTTRDLFWLGWAAEPGVRESWKTGDESARRALLAGVPTGAITVDPAALTRPVWTEGLDWFASPAEVEAAQLALHRRAQTPAGEPLAEILAANPGLPVPSDRLDILSFKGGSAPGVLAGSWLVAGPEGALYAITLQVADPGAAPVLDPMIYFGPVQDALALLAAEPSAP